MRETITRRGFLRHAALAGASAALWTAATRRASAKPPSARDVWPFYAFDNGLGSVPKIEDKVKLLKDLGYVGVEPHLGHDRLPEWLEALDKHGLILNAVYTVPSLEAPMDPKLPESIRRMKGRPTRIELAIRSKTYKKPSDPAGDAKAVDLLKRASDLCADTGPVVSVYPHTGFWTERVEDGVRLAQKSGRENVGTNFNLVHWHWVRQTRPVADVLKEAAPHLFSVTINNGDRAKRTIYPLDVGDYDLVGFMRAVKAAGYTGQVGLQCWSIKEPAEAHLARSMKRWQAIRREVLGEG
ncbi:MAG: TIM barrel protein [Planctomycetota bacterium]|nr:TIM barrel protein [Planctomycetota bacterium]